MLPHLNKTLGIYNKKSNTLLEMFGFLARLARFERTTFRLGGGRSILLSYRRVSRIELPVNYSKEKEKSKAWSANRKPGRKNGTA
jgi:hypothetical protein